MPIEEEGKAGTRVARNRITFDDGGEESPGRGSEPSESYESADPVTVYLDETPPERRRKRLAIFGGVGLLLIALLVGGFALYHFYFQKTSESQSELTGPMDLDSVRDRFYLPTVSDDPELEKAINRYREGFREEARRSFEEYLQTDASDQGKAIALTYLGVMAIENDKLGLARHHLLRALKYQQSFVPALVNLAIAERLMGNLEDARQYAEQARKLAPNDPAVSLLLGNILMQDQKLDEASEMYREALEDAPADSYLAYNLGISLVRQNKLEEAIMAFSRVIDKEPNSSLAVRSHGHMGQIYFSKGNLEMAADHLRKATELAPGEARYHYNLGIVYLRMDRRREAVQSFQSALDSGGDDSRVFRGLSRAFLKLEQPGMARKALEKALLVNPQDTESMMDLGDLQSSEGDLLGAVDSYRRVVQMSPGNATTADALDRLGRVYARLERYEDATQAYYQALRIDPDRSSLYLGLGQALEKAGKPEEAIDIWKKALQRGVKLSPGDEKRIRFALAAVYEEKGAFEYAVREYQALKERLARPGTTAVDPEVHLRLGRVLLKTGSESAALELETAASSSEASPEIRKEAYLLMANLYGKQGNPDSLEKARRAIYQAARLDPRDPDVNLSRARILLATDSPVDREKAIEVLMALTSSDLDSRTAAQAQNLLGVAYYKNGEYRRAMSAFDTAIELDPGLRDAYDNQRAAANAYESSLR
ncbi:MAG: tetratricopeptide repeat protein [Leptospiraceae bacterium]|nr:tetratricopeptide repeat protein [Leptospiraceae bacterium]MCB1170189.1 tetratricopeptide repeat protein [Leptospiraceae bacterium]